MHVAQNKGTMMVVKMILLDNCLDVANSDQANSDDDGVGEL